MKNRSVPVDTILPHIAYQDIAAAIDWLTKAFGFREHYRYGAPDGAQMYLGNAWIMLTKVRPGRTTPAASGFETQCVTIFVLDVDAHYKQAKAAGAKIFEEPNETAYGEYQYGVEDLAGHRWLFARHARNVNPDAWGATIANPATLATEVSPMLAVSDGSAAIKFYEAAFDAKVLWQLGSGADVVAGLSIHGAPFFLAHESPEYGTRGPDYAGFTTVRIELFVDDPFDVHKRALAAGAIERSPIVEHQHDTTGPQPIKRMLQGGLVDPFGHRWLIGQFLE